MMDKDEIVKKTQTYLKIFIDNLEKEIEENQKKIENVKPHGDKINIYQDLCIRYLQAEKARKELLTLRSLIFGYDPSAWLPSPEEGEE